MTLDARDLPRQRRMPRLVEVPRKLQVQPELRLHPEHSLEPERGIRRYATFAMNELVDARIRCADPLGELGLCDAERFEELFTQHRARVGGRSIPWLSHLSGNR